MEAKRGILRGMVRPISLRLTPRQNALIAEAHAKLDPIQKARLQQAHNAAVLRKAREIVSEVHEQRRLKRCAYLSAHKALLAAKDAFDQMRDASSSEVDQRRWRERRELVERELTRIIKGARP